MDQATLQILAYIVVCLSVVCYTILDGFDLGVGALHLFVKKDEDRRVFLNAIGPLWDGNEVWLIIIGGALFVAFPTMYATLFSAFYTPVMILLCGIIFRAVAIEFRSKIDSWRWRNSWDILFSVSSIIIIFCVGVVIGNLILGIPIDENRVFQGNFFTFFRLYPVFVGVMAIGLFMLHGLSFLLMKTEGDLHDRLRKFLPFIMVFFAIFYVLTSFMTMNYSSHMTSRMYDNPVLFLIPLLTLLLIVGTPVLVRFKHDMLAFFFSSLAIIGLFTCFALGTFPQLLRSTIDPELNSITYQNAASSTETLQVFLVIVIIGVPLVFAYGFWIYRVFRGKVKITEHSY